MVVRGREWRRERAFLDGSVKGELSAVQLRDLFNAAYSVMLNVYGGAGRARLTDILYFIMSRGRKEKKRQMDQKSYSDAKLAIISCEAAKRLISIIDSFTRNRFMIQLNLIWRAGW